MMAQSAAAAVARKSFPTVVLWLLFSYAQEL
jgi:hypothetical protein